NLVAELNPSAVLIENVPGLLSPKFDSYRAQIRWHFEKLGYRFFIHRFNACDFGVPQLRPRVTIVALKEHLAPAFRWPAPSLLPPPTVGEALYDLMAANGWEGAEDWKGVAAGVAPTVVGGSKKHGG